MGFRLVPKSVTLNGVIAVTLWHYATYRLQPGERGEF